MNRPSSRTIFIATRGSALALAQANQVLGQCRAELPELDFQLKIIKTTGDKLQTASLAQQGHNLPKGLFTKELETALLRNEADLAVHSLKDLPTDLPAGLRLGAVGARADVRDVLIYREETALEADDASRSARGTAHRGFKPHLTIRGLPAGAVVATSSTRRKAQLRAHNPLLNLPDIRGNVVTRMEKLANQAALDATVLALAGLSRLGFAITPEGRILGRSVPEGLLGSILSTEEMLPCVGQGAIGIEVREADDLIASLCRRLNHVETFQCVLAERSFLAAMGGGCQSPVAAYCRVQGGRLRMKALSFTGGPMREIEGERGIDQAVELGRFLAAELKE